MNETENREPSGSLPACSKVNSYQDAFIAALPKSGETFVFFDHSQQPNAPAIPTPTWSRPSINIDARPAPMLYRPENMEGSASASTPVSEPPVPAAALASAQDIRNAQTQPAAEVLQPITEVAPPSVQTPSALEMMRAQTHALNTITGNLNAREKANNAWLVGQNNADINAVLHELHNRAPVSFDMDEPLPAPPFDVLPEPARRLVHEISCHNPTRQYLSFAALFALFPAATLGRYEIQRANGNNYKHPFTSYIVVSASSGAGKSDILSTLLKPFTDYEEKMALLFSQGNVEAENLLNDMTIKALHKRASNILTKVLEETDHVDTAQSLAMPTIECLQALEAEGKKKSAACKILAGDVTMPQLPFLLAEMGRDEFVLIADAEASILFRVTAKNATVLLKGFVGESHPYSNRKDHVTLKSPIITLLLFMQNSKLKDLFSKKILEDQGLTARILPVVAPDNLGAMPQMSAISEKAWDWYDSSVLSLLEDATRKKSHNEKRTIIRLSLAADHAANAWYRDLKAREGKVSGGYDFFLSRSQQHLLNVAMSLTLMKGGIPDGTEIDAETIDQAIKIMAFFCAHAKSLLDSRAFKAKDNARKILRWFNENQISHFRERDAQRAAHLLADDIRDALAILDKTNHVRSCRIRNRGIVAKEGRIRVVNPHIVPAHFVSAHPSPHHLDHYG